MTNPNVTMRQARAALCLLIAGASAEMTPDTKTHLLDELTVTIAEQDRADSWARRATDLIDDLQAIIGTDEMPDGILALIVKHDMLP